MAVVAFSRADALAFEIHIIHQRVVAQRFCGDAREIGGDACALRGGRGGEDFREGTFQSHRGVAGLVSHGGSEHLAERGQAGAVEIGHEGGSVFPWAGAEHPVLDGRAAGFEEFRQAWPAFLEWAAVARRIPDEVLSLIHI